MRTIDWIDDAVVIVDQTALPGRTVQLRLSTVEDLVAAVRRLAVRGAPALGVAGALGVALAARQYAGDEEGLARAVQLIANARPTAVNLARGAHRAAALLPDPGAVLAEAYAVRDEEIANSAGMARLGADLVTELCGDAPRLLTHCNTGGLATVVDGTALAVVFELHRRGALAGVVASETRPLLQGARLTAWELARAGVPFRVAVVNKIGSYAHALGARAAGIPFICVAPESTVDLATPSGERVEIEDRGAAEVVGDVAPVGTDAINPAFDVTPHSLVTAIVTERRVVRLDRGENL